MEYYVIVEMPLSYTPMGITSIHIETMKYPDPNAKYAHLLPRKCRQTRIENDRNQEMTSHQQCKRKDRVEVLNVPRPWDESSEGHDDDCDDAQGAEEHAPLELLEDCGHLLEEVGSCDFFGSSSPLFT